MSISSGKSRTRLPSAPPHEVAVIESAVGLAQEQLEAVRRNAEVQEFLFEQFPDLFEGLQDQPALDPGAFSEEVDALRGDLDRSRADISRAAESAIRLGESDIESFTQRGLEGVRDTLAPSRGLRPGDSPILGAGSDIVEEGLRQQGQLVRSVRGQEASALATIPFERGLQTADFQQALANQAFQNRLALTGTAGNFGLGLSPQENVSGSLQVIQQPRLAQARVRTKGGGFSSGEAGQLFEGIGSLYGGCWVAAEFYGWGTPQWFSARRWIMERWQGRIADAFRGVYLRHGPRIARWVRRSRLAREALRPVFSWAARRGAE